jgi:hypothetical protein
LQYDDHRVTLHARFPAAEAWEFRLFAKAPSDTTYRYVGCFGFSADAGINQGFPTTFGHYCRFGAALLEPLVDVLPRGGEVTLRIYVPDAHDVQMISADKTWFPFSRERAGGDLWQLRCRLDCTGPYKISAKRDPESRSYDVLVQFD